MQIKDINTMAELCGLVVLSIARKRHYKARLRAPDGREAVHIFPVSESDHRARLNKQSQLRRFAQGH